MISLNEQVTLDTYFGTEELSSIVNTDEIIQYLHNFTITIS